MSSLNSSTPKTLSIGLGGNIPSHAGSPQATLIAARPLIEKAIKDCFVALLPGTLNKTLINSQVDFCWSSLYKTQPIGGPTDQPFFINAVLIVHGKIFTNLKPSVKSATYLLRQFLLLEESFGRKRTNSEVQWGPRTLDIDLLAWGDFRINTSELILPHPRLSERSFVVIPLAEAMKKFSGPLITIRPQTGWD